MTFKRNALRSNSVVMLTAIGESRGNLGHRKYENHIIMLNHINNVMVTTITEKSILMFNILFLCLKNNDLKLYFQCRLFFMA